MHWFSSCCFYCSCLKAVSVSSQNVREKCRWLESECCSKLPWISDGFLHTTVCEV
ncbi:hypothetical protein KP509_19G046700 [Ceratopteris richardii]|uniref:Uncharacterized protein n=1 Tax=Ceratopteris richardii TaxID=49495 RepID=A0A8T2SN95_CERRI|nr:hypothetical protein KP509_19G046700 [Ceratopteris richardii]